MKSSRKSAKDVLLIDENSLSSYNPTFGVDNQPSAQHEAIGEAVRYRPTSPRVEDVQQAKYNQAPRHHHHPPPPPPDDLFTKTNIFLGFCFMMLIGGISTVLAIKLGENSTKRSFLTGWEPLEFNGPFNFSVEVQYISVIEDKYKDKIEAAVRRWESVLIKDYSTYFPMPAASFGCPGVPETFQVEARNVSTILIYIAVGDIIDQNSNELLTGVLAEASHCLLDVEGFVRTSFVRVNQVNLAKMFRDLNLVSFLVSFFLLLGKKTNNNTSKML